ncbi:hypothetical protein [Aurantimonas coralicida]|uniref:hypothetical protein n=1 Tax=Aurantimonas coralicida TaxID=182270 RepID=UPI00138B091C|nr:hypothetical protein [Aurantimonas coralicida]
MTKNYAPATRTALTEEAYLRRVDKLRMQGAREMCAPTIFTLAQTVDWFTSQEDRWSASTVRQYRAAIRFAVEHGYRRGLVANAEVLLAALTKDPSPKTKCSVRRTSARKRKNVPFAEFERVVRVLESGNELDQLASLFLDCNIRIGLRPIEWQSVTLRGKVLVVRCAKFTNDRGIAEFRGLDLKPVIVPPERGDFVRTVQRLLNRLVLAEKAAGGWPTLWSRIASRIARACRVLAIKRIALYTTRHIALATAKQIMVPVEVAALAGHASDRTAMTHYARHRTGFAAHINCAIPVPGLLALVRQPPRSVRQPDGKFVRERRSSAPGY